MSIEIWLVKMQADQKKRVYGNVRTEDDVKKGSYLDDNQKAVELDERILGANDNGCQEEFTEHDKDFPVKFLGFVATEEELQDHFDVSICCVTIFDQQNQHQSRSTCTVKHHADDGQSKPKLEKKRYVNWKKKTGKNYLISCTRTGN